MSISPEDSKRPLKKSVMCEDRIVSPPLSDTPISVNSYISGDFDAEIGITKLFDTESTVISLTPHDTSPHSNRFPCSSGNHLSIQSLSIHPISPIAIAKGVYQSPKGLLEDLEKKPTGFYCT